MRMPHNLTIYHRAVTAGVETYVRSTVNGVQWEDRRAVNRSINGDLQADRIAVFIPYESVGSWELDIAAEDYIVKGIVTDEITAEFSLADLKRAYPTTSAKVSAVDPVDYGSQRLWHWQIGAN